VIYDLLTGSTTIRHNVLQLWRWWCLSIARPLFRGHLFHDYMWGYKTLLPIATRSARVEILGNVWQ
jgi:hypothetical protein